MKIYIGADHHGFRDKKLISDYLSSLGHEVIDEGDNKLDPKDDFPVYASLVAKHVLADNSESSVGLLLCGSGQGMAMAANRFKGIRASLCWDINEAYTSRHDDNANILCLSADKNDWPILKPILNTWLKTKFANEERYNRRIKELDKLG